MAYTFYCMKEVDCTSINQYRIDNAMSDTESDFDTEELEREFDDVLVQLTSIQEIQEDALLRLERLQHLQCAPESNGFDLDMIETMHTAALHEISQTGMSSFGTHLLNYFESHKN